jgi:protein-S-isoprenylcysteine O-methyltransferase Ste14
LDNIYRLGKDAKTMKNTKYDKGSTFVNTIVFVSVCFIIILSPLLNYYEIGIINGNLLINSIGLLISSIGIIIRIISVKTLGKYFMRTLRKTEGHKLVKNGIYKYLRHPGYTGTVLFWIGLSISVWNFITIISIPLLVIIAYAYRIKVEEEMLIKIFGEEYKEYQKETKKIIPLIY